MVSPTPSLLSRWFDVFNSRTPFSSRLERCGYGVNSAAAAAQETALIQMEQLTRSARKCSKQHPGGRNALLPCQKGIIRSITSLRGLYHDLKETVPEVKYVMTSRVNQDCLENTFSQLRGMGGQNHCPDAVEVRNRLRIMLMAPSPSVAARSRGRAVELECDSEDGAAPSEFLSTEALTDEAFEGLNIQVGSHRYCLSVMFDSSGISVNQ